MHKIFLQWGSSNSNNSSSKKHHLSNQPKEDGLVPVEHKIQVNSAPIVEANNLLQQGGGSVPVVQTILENSVQIVEILHQL